MAWPLVLIAGFVVPGGGHFVYGERKRGFLIGSTIILLFLLGILVGGIRVVEFPDFSGPGNLLSKLLTQPTFDCAFFCGPITLVSGYISETMANNPNTAGLISHARLFDIGGLYIGVAGGLNLLAIIDSVGRSMEELAPRDQPEDSTARAAA
jgi:hypothetical protein